MQFNERIISSISGPVSLSVGKFLNKTFFLFGDEHTPILGMCSEYLEQLPQNKITDFFKSRFYSARFMSDYVIDKDDNLEEDEFDFEYQDKMHKKMLAKTKHVITENSLRQKNNSSVPIFISELFVEILLKTNVETLIGLEFFEYGTRKNSTDVSALELTTESLMRLPDDDIFEARVFIADIREEFFENYRALLNLAIIDKQSIQKLVNIFFDQQFVVNGLFHYANKNEKKIKKKDMPKNTENIFKTLLDDLTDDEDTNLRKKMKSMLNKKFARRKGFIDSFIELFSDMYVALNIFISPEEQVILYVGADHVKNIEILLNCLVPVTNVYKQFHKESETTGKRCLDKLDGLLIK